MILLPLLGYPNHPNVTSVIKYYEVHVIVLLEWIPQKGIIYNISTNPKVADMTILSDTSVQFSASYNTHYNVSIVATSTCGQNMTVVDFHCSELLLFLSYTQIDKLNSFLQLHVIIHYKKETVV